LDYLRTKPRNQMKTWNELGISCELGLGTWAWGDKRVWGYGKGYSDSDLAHAFGASISAGVSFLDTAEMYGFGLSEELIGKFVHEQRATVSIATKFMPVPWRLRKRDLVNALRRSISRLGVNSVLLYQIHWPLHVRSLNTWMDALADAVKAGLTETVGVSNYSADQMRRAHERLASHGIPLISNQVEYSLLHRSPETNGLLNTCKELGVKLIAYSPLAMGVLTGKYSTNHPLSGYRGIRFNRCLQKIQNLTGLLSEIGQSHGGKSPSQVALNWAICKGAFPIPGAKNANQAMQNAGAQGWGLPDDELLAIERTADTIRR
jgi:aryl-alcohol dehydrogenase-like predicted oxidoreductase